MAKRECIDLAAQVMRIHAVSEALTKGWDYLESDRRAETLARLKEKVVKLDLASRGGAARPAAHLLENLKILENCNDGKSKCKDVTALLVPHAVELAVEAILDCGCRQADNMLLRDE